LISLSGNGSGKRLEQDAEPKHYGTDVRQFFPMISHRNWKMSNLLYQWVCNLPDKRCGYFRVALAPALQQTQQISRAQLLN
jgi:hypothetical protein